MTGLCSCKPFLLGALYQKTLICILCVIGMTHEMIEWTKTKKKGSEDVADSLQDIQRPKNGGTPSTSS